MIKRTGTSTTSGRQQKGKGRSNGKAEGKTCTGADGDAGKKGLTGTCYWLKKWHRPNECSKKTACFFRFKTTESDITNLKMKQTCEHSMYVPWKMLRNARMTARARRAKIHHDDVSVKIDFSNHDETV